MSYLTFSPDRRCLPVAIAVTTERSVTEHQFLGGGGTESVPQLGLNESEVRENSFDASRRRWHLCQGESLVTERGAYPWAPLDAQPPCLRRKLLDDLSLEE